MFKRFGILIIMVVAFVLSAPAQKDKINQQKQIIANLEKNIAREEKELDRLKKGKASKEQQIIALTRQIEERNNIIRETERQIKHLTEAVAASEKRLGQLGDQLGELEQNVADMVREAYRNYRNHNHLTFMFSSQSFADLAQRIATLRSATNHRQQQIAEITTVRENVQAEKTLLSKSRTELMAVKRDLTHQRTKLFENVKEAKRQVSNMSKKERDVMLSKELNEKKLNSAVAKLRKLIKGNKAGATFSDKTTALNLPVVGGRVKRYKGNMAEIVGKEGAAVTSIYEGKVVDVKRNKVNNKFDVYIAHGEYITSYANLSAVTIAKDANVKKGQRIGTIGSAVNISTMEMEYKIVFGIYAPSPDVTLSAANCFKK